MGKARRGDGGADEAREHEGAPAPEPGEPEGGHLSEPRAEPLRDSPLHPPLAESADAWDATTPAGNVPEPAPGRGETDRAAGEEAARPRGTDGTED